MGPFQNHLFGVTKKASVGGFSAGGNAGFGEGNLASNTWGSV